MSPDHTAPPAGPGTAPPVPPVPPMPRLRMTSDERVRQILDAAQAAFADQGYTATRMDDIAARCGLSKGGVYAHFASKEAVFEQLIARALTPPDLADGVPAGAAPLSADALAHWLVDRLHGFLARPDALAMLRLLIAEGGRVPHLVARWQAEVMLPMRQQLDAQLRATALAEGAGADALVLQAPWLAIAPLLHGLMAQLLMLWPPDPAQQAAARAAHVALVRLLLQQRPAATPACPPSA